MAIRFRSKQIPPPRELNALTSEPFYVLPGGNIEEEPPQRAIPIEQSLEHARFRLQLTALGDERNPDDIAISGVAWAEGGRSKRPPARKPCTQNSAVRALFRSRSRVCSKPSSSASWRSPSTRRAGECRSTWIPPNRLPKSDSHCLLPPRWLPSWLPAKSFCSGAQRHCRADHAGAFVPGLGKECLAYAESYLDLVRNLIRQAETTSGAERQQHLQALRNVLAVDSIHVILTDFRGKAS